MHGLRHLRSGFEMYAWESNKKLTRMVVSNAKDIANYGKKPTIIVANEHELPLILKLLLEPTLCSAVLNSPSTTMSSNSISTSSLSLPPVFSGSFSTTSSVPTAITVSASFPAALVFPGSFPAATTLPSFLSTTTTLPGSLPAVPIIPSSSAAYAMPSFSAAPEFLSSLEEAMDTMETPEQRPLPIPRRIQSLEDAHNKIVRRYRTKWDQNQKYTIVVENRENIVQTMINAYKREEILEQRLQVTFAGEDGEDYDGLSKQIFTLFWSAMLENNCGGTGMKYITPAYTRKFEEQSLQSIGRILFHGFSLYKFHTFSSAIQGLP